MSLTLILTLLALGIALSQACSSERQVTLNWLRLGDLVALSLLGGAAAALLADPPPASSAMWLLGGVLACGAVAHLMLVQLGRRSASRWVIAAGAAACAALLIAPWCSVSLASHRALALAPAAAETAPGWGVPLIGVSLVLAAWLGGGSLMTMLLGHAYLTSGSEMTQQPFLRLVRMLLLGLVVRLGIAAAAVWAWWSVQGGDEAPLPTMEGVMIAARLLMGLFVPIIMTWMALQCVRLRSNQSATGILYVSSTMMLVGEFLGLALAGAHALPF